MRYDTKTLPELLLIAQKHFNKFIRLRDTMDEGYYKCISCGKFKSPDNMHAGHYLSAGHHSYHRFNENNAHGQCPACNTHLHGNLINYRINLIKKIGLEEVEKLEATKSVSQKWDKFQVIEIIEKYKELTKAAA